MHEVQRSVLRRLSARNGLRFSEIKPRGVESNRFMYHLKALIDASLVRKNGLLYKLTAKGKGYIDRLSDVDFKERIQPKIVTLIVCKNEKGQYLLYKRGKQPFLDKIGFPYGKIHMSERIEDAALRELREKTGLTAQLTYRGDVYITVHDEEELLTQMLAHVFSGRKPKGIPTNNSSIGKCFWGEPSKVSIGEEIPGFHQVFRLVEGTVSRTFFKEYFLDVHED